MSDEEKRKVCSPSAYPDTNRPGWCKDWELRKKEKK